MLGFTQGVIILFYCALLVALSACSDPRPRSYFIPVEDSEIYVEESGSGEALIFLHGGFLDHRMWKDQVEKFSKTHRVVLIDFPGHGDTKNGDSAIVNNQFIAAVMDSLHINSAYFAGLSLGGVAVTDFALEFPGRCKKIILAAPGLTGWGWDQDSIFLHRHERARNAAYLAHDTLGYVESFVQSWTDGPNRTPDQVDKEVRTFVKNCVYENIKKHQWQDWVIFTTKPPAIEVLDSIKIPTLILVGDKDTKDILMLTELMEQKIPSAKKITIPGAGHMLNLENPEVFNRELSSFLSAN